MIRLATASDADRLKRIWHTCFGDPEQYIEFFFQNEFDPQKTVVFEADGQACSMFFLLDSTVWISGAEHQAAYLYAAATLPEYRSRGFMGRMIQFSGELCRAMGKGYIVLVPASESLFDYYSRFGFQTYFYDAPEVWYPSSNAWRAGQGSSPQADSSTIEQIRRAAVRENGGLMWNGAQLNYVLREHQFTGGEIFCTEFGYALYHRSADSCTVDEMIALPETEERLKRDFLDYIDVREIQAVRPCAAGMVPRARGMLLPLLDTLRAAPETTGYPYIGLTLG